SGDRSSSPRTLLTWTPVPGTTTPEPSPFEQVTAHAQPSASSTETCVVDPSRLAAAQAAPVSPDKNSGVRSRSAATIAATSAGTSGGPGIRSSSASARPTSTPPALGGGFVQTVTSRNGTRCGSRRTTAYA